MIYSENAMVSIVLPSLNSADYITECIDSIINQNYRPLELICVDAESEDGTFDKLKQYEKKYKWIHVFTSRVRSYGHQVNLGIKHATGRYLMIVESDDILPKDACKILVDSMIKHGADFVRGSMMDFVEYNHKKMAYVTSYYYSDFETDRLINLNEETSFRRTNTICIQASIYNIDFIKKCEIELHESAGASYQDTGFCLQVSAQARSCAFINRVVYYRRRGNESSSYFVGENYNKIIDEYKWIANKSFMDTLVDSVNDLFLYTKLYSYYWMLARVCKELQIEFIQSIQNELNEYESTWCEKNLNDSEKIMLSELRGKSVFSGSIERKYNSVKRILGWLDCGSIVLFGIGRLGKSVAENIIDIQTIFGKNVLDSICDNNEVLFGTEFNGKIIASVETTVSNFNNSLYLVVNKRESAEMKKQLVCLGISEEQVYVVNSVEQISELFDFERVLI